MNPNISRYAAAALLATATFFVVPAVQAQSIDNSSLSSTTFRPHVRTFGLVYTLPADVNAKLDATTKGMLKEKLLNAKLDTEAQMHNVPHVTVVHIHSADATTPEKMLKALPNLPKPLNVMLKNFYTTEAAKGAGQPWWVDLGIVKEGVDFEAMMTFNTEATRGAGAAPRRAAAALHWPGLRKYDRRREGTGQDHGCQRGQRRQGRQGIALAQSAQHLGIQQRQVLAGDTEGDEHGSGRVQPDIARWHPGFFQDDLHRRTRICRQRVARDL
jgi:hypothetical protein